MKRTVRLTLNSRKFGSQTTVEGVHVGDDNSCELIITVTDGNKILDLSSETTVATMCGTKPDGTTISRPCSIVNNNIVYTLEKQDTAVSGNVLYQVTVVSDDGISQSIIATAKFTVAVMKNIYMPIYRVLESEPSDWSTNYTAYYRLLDNKYTAITDSTCPAFLNDTFYFLVNPNYDSKDDYGAFQSALARVENLIGRASDILTILDKKINDNEAEHICNKVSAVDFRNLSATDYPNIKALNNYHTNYVEPCYDDINNLEDSKADKATTLEGYGITDGLANGDGTVKLANLAQDILDYIVAHSNGEGGGVTLTQVQTLLADYAKASELDNKEDVSNRVTSITQAFTDESGIKYPTVLALLKYLEDYYYNFEDIYAAFDGIRIDDNGNLIVLLPDGEEKSLGSVKGSDYVLTEADKTEIANAALEDINTILSGKADKSTTYTKTEVDTALATKPSFDDVYTVEEADDHFLSKHDAGNTYATKAELVTKANKETTYTKVEVDTALSGKLDNTEGSVKRENIEVNAIGTDEIDSGAVDTVNIADKSVTIAKLSDDLLNYIKTSSGTGGGKSAYDIALEHGFIGSEEDWLKSLKGGKGDKGDKGDTPVKGIDYWTDEDKSEIIQEINSALVTVPDYIKVEAERVAKSIQSVRTGQSFSFAGVSDAHIAYSKASETSVIHAGMGLKCIREIANVDLVAHLGDYINGSHESTKVGSIEEYKIYHKAMFEACNGVDSVWLQGNHDANYQGKDIFDFDEMYAYIGSNNTGNHTVDYGNENKLYGFIDYPTKRLRVIYLNSSDGWKTGITDDQSDWLSNTAFDLSDKSDKANWGIIIFIHIPVTFGDNAKVLTAINNYSGEAEIIGIFHGHCHNFRTERVSDKQIWQIGIPELCVGRSNEYGESSDETYSSIFGEFDSEGNPVHYEKVSDTAQDTSFNIVTIDRANKKIYCHNFGAGYDRTINYGDNGDVLVNYSITNDLTNVSTNNTATTIQSGNVYTANLTAKDGYVLDTVKVTMGGADITSTAYTGGVINIPSVTGNVEITAIATKTATYINLFSPTDTDFADAVRFNSSGGTTEGSGFVTGFIPAVAGDTIYVRCPNGDYSTGTGNNIRNICTYKSDKTVINALYPVDTVIDSDGLGFSYTVVDLETAYIRVCGHPNGNYNDFIVTKNEPIE